MAECEISDLKEGQHVTVSVSKGLDKIVFETEIAVVLEDSVLLSPITHNGQLVGFNRGLIISAVVDHEPLPLKFLEVAMDVIKYHGEVYTRMQSRTAGIEVNRRKTFRVPIVKDGVAQMGENRTTKDVIIKDVSNSGFSFVLNEDVSLDSKFVRVTFKDNGTTIVLSGRIVRQKMIKENCYLFGCKLVKKPNGLDKYLADKQIEQARKKQERRTV